MKRLLDILLILLALPVWLAVFIVVWLVVRVLMGPPVFFRQERAGHNGKSFRIIKFRTMSDERDESGELLPDEERLTRVGRLLRKLSFDEVPGLFNVLRGDMTLIGPRPLPVKYVTRYSAEQARRLECVPGITGWAQVNGRNLLDWNDRFEHDVWYLENRSTWLDFKILFLTLATVIRREGISAENVATMTEFMGSESNHDHERPDSSE